jgi:hypothetical protein
VDRQVACGGSSRRQLVHRSLPGGGRGVLDGKEATTHWIAADAFRRRFPRVLLRPERMIVDAGDVISSGGPRRFSPWSST